MTTFPGAPTHPATTRARWFAAELTMATQGLGAAGETTDEHDGVTEGEDHPGASADDR